LDNHLWRLTLKWAKHSHPNKSTHWVVARYFGQFNHARQDRWVFGDRDSGAYLVKFAWTKIVRHQMVTGHASPDDPAQAQYWAERRGRQTLPPMDKRTAYFVLRQRGRCALCDGYLLHADDEPQSPHEWERWFIVVHRALRKQHIAYWGRARTDEREIRLVHAYCHRRNALAAKEGPASTMKPASL
jgi:RNA-directed DNA polymerase